ncbi:multicilin [Silurus meridionalis]|uniref:Multicilin n=1 Tax=Silurus meridionalis TaxID=175797 RepID=A0A8T0B8C9_SILME|nr:multicilin [Silurus meridionalis]KAF7700860.1 hypothetical protein HF521_002025 [Silurus meridionalis]
MMDATEPAEHYLDYAIERNRQLHICVQKKQEEISALKEKNAQLKELVKQAETYAAVLDVFTSQPEDTSDCLSDFTPHSHSFPCAESPEWHFDTDLQPTWLESLLDHTPPEEEEEWSHTILSEHTNTGMKRQLWPSSTDSPAESPDKKSRLDQEVYEQSQHHSFGHPASEPVQVFGSFHGLHVLKATPSAKSDPWREGKCAFFKISIRDHCTVQTRVFPHGKTFTSHAPDGGCRFLWIPEQN